MKKTISILCGLLMCTQSFALITVDQSGAGDYTNITDAVAAATSGEEVRVIDQGTYEEGFAISDLILTSVPAGATINNATIILEGTAPVTMRDFNLTPNGNNGIHLDGTSQEITLSGLNIDGALTGIAINGAVEAEITSCTVTNSLSHGVAFGVENDAATTFTLCTISGSADHGVAMFRNATANFYQCQINDNDKIGIIIDGAMDTDGAGFFVNLSGTQVNENFQQGMAVYRKASITIADGSQINSNGRQGIQVDVFAEDAHIMLNDSEVASNGLAGLAYYRNVTSAIDGCNIHHNAQFAIVRDFEYNPTVTADITIKDCNIYSNQGNAVLGIAQSQANNWTITGNTFYGNLGRNLSIEGATAQNVSVDIQNNIFRDGSGNADVSVVVWNSTSGSIIANNMFDQGLAGINVSLGDINVYHNTIVNNPAAIDTVGIDVSDGDSKLINIKNNIISGVQTGVMSADGVGLSNTVVDYNLINAEVASYDSYIEPLAGTYNKTDISAGFVMPSTQVGQGNYKLNSLSAAVNAGQTGLGITTDLIGNTRTETPDMGAYEYQPTPNAARNGWVLY